MGSNHRLPPYQGSEDTCPRPSATPSSKRPWSLHDRLDKRLRCELIDAYRAGATAASLTIAHGVSLRSVKRLVAAAGVRRQQLPA
jgi:hypothetical protein